MNEFTFLLLCKKDGNILKKRIAKFKKKKHSYFIGWKRSKIHLEIVELNEKEKKEENGNVVEN